MKQVICVSLGSSEHDYEFDTEFLDETFHIKRIGTDGDDGAAWEQLQRLQARCDAIAIGRVTDTYQVGDRNFVDEKTKRLTNVVTRVPVSTGSRLRNLFQTLSVRHTQHKLVNYFNNNKVLFMSGIANYPLATTLAEYTPNLKFADSVLQASVPKLLTSLTALELYALGQHGFNQYTPEMVRERLPKVSAIQKRVMHKAMKDSHVIVGTCSDIIAYGNKENLDGKTLITSMVTDDDVEQFKAMNVNLVVDTTPMIFDQVVGLSVVEAMILAATEVPADELSSDDIEEIIRELDIEPRLIHPTGTFRNIRRFAFVVHPLSQEYIRNVTPIPKKLAFKPMMDALEKSFAYTPPIVYSEVSGIKSPTGAECEGWLITVGGTPKEMLSHSPEFTYRRLLAAAKMAEKMGAQIMGLGAFTKVVGDAGVTVARRADIPVTTGNSYSASGALWAATDAMKRLKLVEHPEPGEKVKAKTMVVGATGAIGSVSARLMAMAFDEVVIAARNEGRLKRLQASIMEDTPDAKITWTTTPDEYLSEMDMIVTSTSGAGKKILDIMKVKPGCVITDVARPLDLPASEVAKRPDVLVIESGEIELPGDLKMRSIRLPKNVVFACMAETIALALEGRFEVFTIGRNTEWEKVKEIYMIGLKHGMKLAAISGVKGVYTEEDLDDIRNRALEARKTWQPPA